MSLRTLRGRLLLIALTQAVAIAVIAIVVAFFTMPSHRNRPPGPPPGKPGIHKPDKRPRSYGPEATLALMLGVLVVGGVLTGRWLIPPIVELQRATKSLGKGDFSTRVQLERGDELGDLGSAFNDMASRVEQMLQSERELVANISHELRTPLSRVRVAVELLEEGDIELSRAALPGITDDLAEIESLIDDIFAAARLESSLSPERVLAEGRAATTMASLAANAERKFRVRHVNRRVETSLESDTPICVHAVLMRRVIENLLENAHKYTPDQAAAIKLTVRTDGEDVVLEVADSGKGISPEDQARLFEPFYRGNAALADKPGLGLGLSLVQRIIAAHGGTIDVDSVPGVGTTVSVRLKRSSEADAEV